MASVVLVVALVVAKKASEMVLVGDDYVVSQLSPNGTDDSFGNTILPGRAIGGAHRFDARVSNRGFDASAEVPVESGTSVARYLSARSCVREFLDVTGLRIEPETAVDTAAPNPTVCLHRRLVVSPCKHR